MDLISKSEIKSYVNLAFLWFSFVAFCVLVLIGPFGYFFFYGNTGTVNWIYPWCLLITITSISIIFIPFQILIEACQEQVELYKARALSAIISAFSLCVALYCGFGLYSIAISFLCSNVLLNLLIAKTIFIAKILIRVKAHQSRISSLREIRPMLSKISFVWVTGYFFLNSFNLIAFKNLSLELAGQFWFYA